MNTQTAAGIQSYLDSIVRYANEIERDLRAGSLPDEMTVAKQSMSIQEFIELIRKDDPIKWDQIATPFTAILSAAKDIESNMPISLIGKQLLDSGLGSDSTTDSLRALALVSMSRATLIQAIANQIIDPRMQLWFADLDDDPDKSEEPDSGSQ